MKKYTYYIFSIIILCSSISTQAGVVYSGTRFIYNEKNKNIIIQVKNRDTSTSYLLQNWLEGNEGKKTPFMITPPLFKINNGQDGILKIIKIKPIEENDRESIFYFNSKAIPIAESSDNNLHISIKSIFKLFYRPTGLTDSIDEAVNKISFSLNDKNEIIINNKSGYFFTIINIFNTTKRKEISIMVSPFSEYNIGKQDIEIKNLNWSYLNDFGNEIEIINNT